MIVSHDENTWQFAEIYRHLSYNTITRAYKNYDHRIMITVVIKFSFNC